MCVVVFSLCFFFGGGGLQPNRQRSGKPSVLLLGPFESPPTPALQRFRVYGLGFRVEASLFLDFEPYLGRFTSKWSNKVCIRDILRITLLKTSHDLT